MPGIDPEHRVEHKEIERRRSVLEEQLGARGSVDDLVEQGLRESRAKTGRRWLKPVAVLSLAGATAAGITAGFLIRGDDSPSEPQAAIANEPTETTTASQEANDTASLLFETLGISGTSVEKYGLGVIDPGFSAYTPGSREYAQEYSLPTKLIDFANTPAKGPFTEHDIEVLAPAYLNNYIMSVNFRDSSVIYSDAYQTYSGDGNVERLINPIQNTFNSDVKVSSISFSNLSNELQDAIGGGVSRVILLDITYEATVVLADNDSPSLAVIPSDVGRDTHYLKMYIDPNTGNPEAYSFTLTY